jgi:hypothetical protein
LAEFSGTLIILNVNPEIRGQFFSGSLESGWQDASRRHGRGGARGSAVEGFVAGFVADGDPSIASGGTSGGDRQYAIAPLAAYVPGVVEF